MMGATKGAAAMGFLAGIGVAIACGARSMSGPADAGPTDSPTADMAQVDAAPAEVPSLDGVRVRTADTDAEQYVEKETSVRGTLKAVADGPVVITDIWTTSEHLSSFEFQVRGDSNCGATVIGSHFSTRRFTGPLHGIRIALRSGEFLCMEDADSSGFGVLFQWSGYRPYPAN